MGKFKRRPGDVVFDIINGLFFALFTLVCIFPFYYLFINTISDNELVRKGLVNFIPRGIHFENYIRLLQVNDLFTSFAITLARTILGTLLMVLASAFVGYMVTQQEMWGRSFWYRFLVITMYFNAGIIPWYLNMSMLGLTNTFWAYIIPGIVAPYNIILVKTYIESAIPLELQESASLDGASHLKIFWKIILPISKPILVYTVLTSFIGPWCDFILVKIIMGDNRDNYTVALGLQRMTDKEYKQTYFKQFLAGSVIVAIPITVLFLKMQNYYVEGVTAGGVKG